ncbi:MAG: sulfate transporter CysZ [Gammaproteobacteria bacterium]|nr:sulfate transporter CysZ [Gammaproteobacteria bacterium]
MIRAFLSGFLFSLKGLKIINQRGIRHFVMIPLMINISLFSMGIAVLIMMFSQWMESLMPDFPDWLSWLEDSIRWLLWPLFTFMIFFIAFYSFTFIANLIAAPFNSLLSEKVEASLGKDPDKHIPTFPPWVTIKKSVGSEIGKLLYLVKWSLLILVLSFIPILNITAPVLWFVFGAWMLALEYLDYPMNNHGHYFKEINQHATKQKTSSLGLGTGILLLTSIPVVNFFAMPASVAGATALWVKREQTSNGN